MLYKMWDCFFRGDFDRYGRQVYIEHYKEVRSLTSKHNLLEFDVKKDDWRTLCAFLDVPQPTTLFPDGNDTADFKRSCIQRNTTKAFQLAMRTGLIVGLIAAMVSLSRGFF
jgi:hypothetical protein